MARQKILAASGTGEKETGSGGAVGGEVRDGRDGKDGGRPLFQPFRFLTWDLDLNSAFLEELLVQDAGSLSRAGYTSSNYRQF